MLRIAQLSKRFDSGIAALHGVSLDVEHGEILGIVGRRGCGKSTLLRIVGGLDWPSLGGVMIDDEAVRAPRAEIGVVFGEPRLMPWLTVGENVRLGLAGFPTSIQRELAAEAIVKLGLEHFAHALPKQLPGGVAERAAIARALAAKPEILLLDEPFGALDAVTRRQLQDQLLDLWAADRPTMLFATHDIDEAVALSDRVIVMRGQPGRVHREYRIDLPRPRGRADAGFQDWKTRILDDLDPGEET